MDSTVLRSFRSLLAAMALLVAAYAIAASGQAAQLPTASKPSPVLMPQGSAAADPSPSAASEEHRAAIHGSHDANPRLAAASAWTLGGREGGAERPMRPSTAVQDLPAASSTRADAPELLTWLGHAPMPAGLAFVLASIGLMASIARRRRLD